MTADFGPGGTIRGTHAARLAAGHAAGRRWSESDTGLEYLDDGTNWICVQRFGMVSKPADQTISNNAALQDDTDLFFPIESGETFIVEAFLRAQASSVNADWQFGWSGTGITGPWGTLAKAETAALGGWIVPDTLALTPVRSRRFSETLLVPGASMSGNDSQLVRLTGWFIAGSATTVRLRWAQNAAVVENNVLKQYSALLLRKVSP